MKSDSEAGVGRISSMGAAVAAIIIPKLLYLLDWTPHSHTSYHGLISIVWMSSIAGELNIIYLYMVDSPLNCDYVTITRWIALRSGLKGLVTAVAPLISARVHRLGGAAGWICVAGTEYSAWHSRIFGFMIQGPDSIQNNWSEFWLKISHFCFFIFQQKVLKSSKFKSKAFLLESNFFSIELGPDLSAIKVNTPKSQH